MASELSSLALRSAGPAARESSLSPPNGSSLRATSPLSSKVSGVLSSSYADADFREALSLLDERGVLNTAETRRRLRLDVQKELIDSNGEIIAEFGKVAEQLRRIGHSIERLNASYGDIKTRASAAHAATSGVVDEASSLMAQRRQVETQQRILAVFTKRFVLSEDEVAILTLNSEPVDDSFFTVLAKAKRISEDCELLLGFESRTMGLEVMDQASRNLNLAFQKLYRWIQRELKNINLESPQIGSSIRHALRVLAERPPLFQNCLDFFAEAREHSLSESFYTALTGSSTSGREDPSVKPIEMAAHDPLRYIGDMLAWLHSAAVSEREALEILFVSEGDEIAKGIQAGRENEIWRLVADGTDAAADFDPVSALNDLVDRDMSGAARILRQRVEQVVQANEDTILAYRLANLLSFYRATFARLLSSDSGLVGILDNLESEALRQFRALMRDHIAALQGDFQHPPANCGVPEFLDDALEQLKAILRTYETSLTPSTDREADFQPILAEAFDPFMDGCVHLGRGVPAPASSVFLINCAKAATAVLSSFDFTRSRAQTLDKRVEDEARKLVESQYSFFRAESGLGDLMDALQPLKPDSKEDARKLRSLAPVQGPQLVEASQRLDDFLPSALMDAMENLRHLQDSKLAREITEEAAERFCADFEHVEEMLILADGLAEEESGGQGFQSLRETFPRTTGEIQVLLS